jgi:hypothetical protein
VSRPRSSGPAAPNAWELIDRLDRRRQPLRDALAELRHLYALLSRKLTDERE